MTEKKSEPWDWARKHTQLKSDPIIKMVNDSPEKFMISRTEIIQLVLDLQTMKNRFLNMAIWQSVTDEWIDKPEEEKQADDDGQIKEKTEVDESLFQGENADEDEDVDFD